VKNVLLWGDVFATFVLVGVAIRFAPHNATFYSGLALTAVCLPFWIAARLQLGGSFSVTAQARRLVTTGLYSRLRNPIYLFGSLAYLGGMIALQIWPLLVAWLAMTPIQLLRIRKEEKVLAGAFGLAYEDYRARTWF
jgi:protein-S-isoprenylcysteine O-methyltransferase Ste14